MFLVIFCLGGHRGDQKGLGTEPFEGIEGGRGETGRAGRRRDVVHLQSR